MSPLLYSVGWLEQPPRFPKFKGRVYRPKLGEKAVKVTLQEYKGWGRLLQPSLESQTCHTYFNHFKTEKLLGRD